MTYPIDKDYIILKSIITDSGYFKHSGTYLATEYYTFTGGEILAHPLWVLLKIKQNTRILSPSEFLKMLQ